MDEQPKMHKIVIDDTVYETQITRNFANRKTYAKADPKEVTAYIPGIIQKVYVQPGQRLRWGDSLLILEAMKMRNEVTAPIDGVVKEVLVKEGQMVRKNELLVTFE